MTAHFLREHLSEAPMRTTHTHANLQAAHFSPYEFIIHFGRSFSTHYREVMRNSCTVVIYKIHKWRRDNCTALWEEDTAAVCLSLSLALSVCCGIKVITAVAVAPPLIVDGTQMDKSVTLLKVGTQIIWVK